VINITLWIFLNSGLRGCGKDALGKGAVSTKEKNKVKNKDTGKKVAKIYKEKKMGIEKNKKAAETAK
jgi:formylmethanofuran dehydrogenase subunit E